ncbi:hypothetical protein PGTUg99_036200 [Puccinia graminis f. sp. tritici]|uniref:Uncharacterized protein n=1 Tax=Puccinia graminis f. sp. tritici TaxID=56615 RepID=A0A5B0R8S2_PUCGR|nr:hypothetical protein PGTUg99_028285 [Puccinia graminis f. sp. tritici]KAA1127400.1 hypothetical protein PGTUg99_036200 [Puccinia graminis f. sp. tritici]
MPDTNLHQQPCRFPITITIITDPFPSYNNPTSTSSTPVSKPTIIPCRKSNITSSKLHAPHLTNPHVDLGIHARPRLPHLGN